MQFLVLAFSWLSVISLSLSLDFNNRGIFDVEVLNGLDTVHLIKPLLKVLDREAIHVGFVLGGASREVTLIVVVLDTLSAGNDLIKHSLFIRSSTAELSH